MVGSVGNGGADHGLDQRSSMDYGSGSDNSLDQRSGMYDWNRVNDGCADHSLEQGSRVHDGHGVHNWRGSIGAYNGSGGIGLHQRHLAYQIHIALMRDGRGGGGIHIRGLGQHCGLHQGVCLGEQARSGGGNGKAGEEGDLQVGGGERFVVSSQGAFRRRLRLTNLNIFECGWTWRCCESIATVDVVGWQRALLYGFLVTTNSGYHCRGHYCC